MKKTTGKNDRRPAKYNPAKFRNMFQVGPNCLVQVFTFRYLVNDPNISPEPFVFDDEVMVFMN